MERPGDWLAWTLGAGGRPVRVTTLEWETIVPASVERTFGFFSDAANLERLTPPWLNFHIQTPQPIAMREGTLIDYRIRLYGVPIPWRSRIDVWEPGRRFVDRQLVGPYRWWHHEHVFREVPSGTAVIDRIELVPRLAWFTRGFVIRDVQRIFAYRQETLQSIFSNGRR